VVSFMGCILSRATDVKAFLFVVKNDFKSGMNGLHDGR